MKQENDKQLAIEVRRNERYTGSEDAEALAAWHRESREMFGQLPSRESEHKKVGRELDAEFLQALKTLAPAVHSRGTALSEALRHSRPQIVADDSHTRMWKYLREHLEHRTWAGEGPVLPPPPDGWFWWAQTQPFRNHHGLHAQFESDGLHFFGSLSYNGDPLVHHHIGATATFELAPNRRPHSANGRWRSRPHVELFGRINGWTGVHHWMWAADDKWCKCRLFLRQTALQFVGPTLFILGTNTELRTLIDEENKGRGTHADMPGFQPMPFLEFGVVSPTAPVIVDLEVRFDIELEGDSFIGFSPQPNPFQSVLLRTFQWQVEAI